MAELRSFYHEENLSKAEWIIISLFLVSLYKFSLLIEGQGVTANYLYVFIPIAFWVMGINRRFVVRDEVVFILSFYVIIYLIGLPEDIININSDIADPVRRLASFIVFMAPFSLAFIKFRPVDIYLFKVSIILAGMIYSLSTILEYVSLAPHYQGLYSLKGEIGSQRYGFVLSFAFFIALLNDRLILRKWILVQRVLICSILFIGLVFTFSRSSLLALGGGFVFLVFVVAKGLFHRKNENRAKHNLIPLILVLVLVASFYIVFQHYYTTNFLDFYRVRLVDGVLNGSILKETESNPVSSGGFRYHLLTHIYEYLSAHPFFGSKYQGLYLLYDEYKGGMSSHNQYADVFLRTGFLGGALWLYLLYRVFRFFRHDNALRIGLFSVLVFGLFQETFKLSHGSFIFGVLLSLSYMRASILSSPDRAQSLSNHYFSVANQHISQDDG